jgi:glycine C-acetyltransferase
MPADRLDAALVRQVADLDARGVRKRFEPVVTAVLPGSGERGPRYLLEGEGDRPFLRMNSNGYLGLALHDVVRAAEEDAVRRFGTGPQAVRFISGTYGVHTQLEARLAAFHGREAAMLFSSAYACVLGTLPALMSPSTAVASDELNHNCIITATRLAQPVRKVVYPHADVAALDAGLAELAGACDRVLVVTDGVFSMRGDHAPLDHIVDIARRHDPAFAENVAVVVDDSHGVGALGATGRGTEEATGARADVLIGTLGKAFGVNGGYVVGSQALVDVLRETATTYVYSNPITPAEAAAALASVELLDSEAGRVLLARLRASTRRLRDGLAELGFETIPGEHPVVPLLVRDTERAQALAAHLRVHGVLATGLAYPVVPRGEEELRFQVSADHTEADIDAALAALAAFPWRP